jgi:hypothetical protein
MAHRVAAGRQGSGQLKLERVPGEVVQRDPHCQINRPAAYRLNRALDSNM